MFPGRSVIVDTWNTWCQPCIDAMNSIMAYREKIDTQDIVFLYISSESSPLQKWKATVANFGGVQVRLNEKDFRKIGEQYGLLALPSYLVFDKNHDLKDVSCGKPNFSDLEKWVELVQ